MKLKANFKELHLRELFLLLQIILVVAWHLGYPLYSEYILDQKKKLAKVAFNNLVDENGLPADVLRCLKILINNYESLTDVEILNSRNIEVLEPACNGLIPAHKRIFLHYSNSMNMSIMGSILLPAVSFTLKSLFRSRRLTSK